MHEIFKFLKIQIFIFQCLTYHFFNCLVISPSKMEPYLTVFLWFLSVFWFSASLINSLFRCRNPHSVLQSLFWINMNSFYWGYVFSDHLKPKFLNIILDKKNLKYLSCPFENSKITFFLNRLLHSSKDQSRTIYKLEMWRH